MKNPLLVKAAKRIKHMFITEWVNDDILFIRFQGIEMPLAQLLYQEQDGEKILISIAVDCKESNLIARLVLECMLCANTDLAEPFYIDKGGMFHFGEEAFAEYEKDDTTGYIKIPTSSSAIH